MNNQQATLTPDYKIRLLVADDHEIYRDGLALLFSRTPGIEFMGGASNGKELLEKNEELKPDVILTDLRMPVMNGIEATKQLKLQRKDVQVIALSTFENEHLIVEALEAGASGYIIKNAGKDEIIEAVQSAFTNHLYYCRSTSFKLARLIEQSRFNPYNPDAAALFTDLERRIIYLICEEKSTQEIADMVCLAKRTIDGYRVQILDKMKVKTPAGVAVYAMKNGLYRTEER